MVISGRTHHRRCSLGTCDPRRGLADAAQLACQLEAPAAAECCEGGPEGAAGAACAERVCDALVAAALATLPDQVRARN